MKITIWFKLLVGIILIIALITFLSIVGINSINKLQSLSSDVFNESITTNKAQDLKVNFERLIMPPNDYLIHGDAAESHNFVELLGGIKKDINQYSELLAGHIEKLDRDELYNYVDDLEILGLQIFGLKDPVGNTQGAALMEKMDSTVEVIITKIDNINTSSARHLRNDISIAYNTYVKYTRIIIIVGIVIIFILLIGGFFYVREITKPLQHLKLAAQKISSGEPYDRPEVKTRDEIEDLANSFNQMIGVIEKTAVNREYFNHILNRMEDSLIITDVNNNIKIVNQATLDMLGYQEEEIIGKSVELIINDKGPKDVSVKIEDINNNKYKDQINNVYNTYYTKGKKPVPVIFSRSLMYDNDKNILGMIILAHHYSENGEEVRAELEEDDRIYRNIKTIGEIPLTRRELEIIKLIAEEFSNLEISEKLFISVRTVETHRRNIMQKLHINSVISLVHYAIQNNII